MSATRPDPDQLLSTVRADEARTRRGRLRIFFGASAGIGKTYSMLEAARARRAAGTDLVVGYVEPHGRVETERLLEGLEQLPTLPVRHRDIVRQEFDLDAALKRRPEILVVDELAHSNLAAGTPPPRHGKRWQDIEELLDAGINVWTTVNVQHLESLNDLVTQITGIRQRETFPDRIFDEADDIELIDLPPDDLIGRLKAGKIYIPQQADTAIERFFRKSNLIALRELALRRMADRVDASARVADPGKTSRPWLARDRLLVALGPGPQAEQLVRAGKRMADALDAEWTVVYVETPALLRLSATERDRRIRLLRLGESLGAETVTLDGPSAAQTLIEYARTRKATRVLVGTPRPRGWRSLFAPSTTLEVLRNAEGFDIIVVAPSDVAPTVRPADASTLEGSAGPFPWQRYAGSLMITAACTAIAFGMFPHVELVNLVMVYVLGATVAAVRYGRGPGAFASVLNVALFDFCFVPPQFTFVVSDAEYLLTFAVMLIVTLVIGTLMASVRQQTRVAGARERRTASLYAMSRELAASRGLTDMATLGVKHVAEVFECQAVVLLTDPTGKIVYPGEQTMTGSFHGADLAIAQWVADHGRRAGLGSDTLPAAPALYLPLGDSKGVLAVLPANKRRVLLPEQRHLLETFAGQIGLALERGALTEKAETARIAVETESLRNTLLASISHDLRTPLAVMAGAASTLAERGPELDAATRTALARSIETKANEMSTLISNVLDLTRFESGQLRLRPDWETLDDLVGTALARLDASMAHHAVSVELPGDLPPVQVDASLIVQVLVNLLDNAAKYTPPGTPIRITAREADGSVQVVVEDEGPGLPGESSQLFQKFKRGVDEGATAGAGLGLAICRAILRAHGSDIEAGMRPGGGARFQFRLPLGEPSP